MLWERRASVDKLREVADAESEGLLRYTAEAVAKSKGEFLFDLTERVRDIQEDDQYVSTVTAAHKAREEGMTAIIKAYQESITKLREQYEKVFDELGEIRDSEFEALA